MRMMKGLRGSTRPAEQVDGPTGSWLHFHIAEGKDEDDAVVWTYDGVWFELGELESVENGVLPDGAQWTEEVHCIFRRAQHRRTDDLYGRAYRSKRTAADPAPWTAYITALDEWNDAVSALAGDFSTDVPALPTAPF